VKRDQCVSVAVSAAVEIRAGNFSYHKQKTHPYRRSFLFGRLSAIIIMKYYLIFPLEADEKGAI